MRSIIAALALVLLIASPVVASKPASISVSPSTVTAYDEFVVTFDDCRALRVTNSAGVSYDISNPLSTGSSTWSGIGNYLIYSGPGTYTWDCLWANGQVLASTTLEVTS
jgi:hypothetical protein